MKPLETTASSPPIQVLFALLPGSLVLDWAGPAEALRIANQALLAHGLPPRFQLHFVSPEPELISSVGLTLAGLLSLPATLPPGCWPASARHLARLFMAHAGIAPLEYLRRIRLAAAQAALQSGCNVTQAAAMAGFSSDTQLRRAWHLFDLPGTPSAQNQLLKK